MKNRTRHYAANVIIILLVVANLLTGSMIYIASKPKCICDDCSRVRVSGSRYCHDHEDYYNFVCKVPAAHSSERVIWLEAKSKN